jgi:glutathione S-transferase
MARTETKQEENIFYYTPGSVFSNVGLLLLYQKGVENQFTFKPIQMAVDNIAPWYIQLNPKGQVPTLVHQSIITPDTLAIAEYLDRHFEPALFATSDQNVRDLVEQWRQIRVLAMFSGKKTPSQDVSGIANAIVTSREQVLAYQKEHPELNEAYQTRLAIQDERSKFLVDHDMYVLHKQKLDQLLDRTEQALQKNQGRLLPEYEFTVADTYAVGFLYALHQKFDANLLVTRPQLQSYYLQQVSNPCFIKAFSPK